MPYVSLAGLVRLGQNLPSRTTRNPYSADQSPFNRSYAHSDYYHAEGWNLVTGYDKRPYQFMYEPQLVAKNMSVLDEHSFPAWLLPLFTLTDAANVAGPCDNDRDARDSVAP